MVMACGPAIITAAFPERERGRAMGFIGTVVAVGLTAGPGVGGLIMSKLSWRAIFYINIPLGIAGTAISHKVLREREARSAQARFDWAGGLLAAVCLAALLVGVESGGEGWTHAAPLTLLAISMVAAFLFVRVEAGHPAPLVDPALFHLRIFRHGIAGAVVLFICHFTAYFLVPFHLVKVMRLPIARVGLIMTAAPLVHMVVSPLAGWLYDRIGSRIPCTCGMLASSAALLLLSGTGPDAAQWEVALKLAFLGLGASMFQPANTTAVMNSVPPQRLGSASSIVAASRNLGMVLGVSMAATFFDMGYAKVAGGGGLQDFRPGLMDAFVSGWHSAFWVAAGLGVVGALISASRGRG
jgi:EmrB/QacA subfamily drug resistance transporter